CRGGPFRHRGRRKKVGLPIRVMGQICAHKSGQKFTRKFACREKTAIGGNERGFQMRKKVFHIASFTQFFSDRPPFLCAQNENEAIGPPARPATGCWPPATRSHSSSHLDFAEVLLAHL